MSTAGIVDPMVRSVIGNRAGVAHINYETDPPDQILSVMRRGPSDHHAPPMSRDCSVMRADQTPIRIRLYFPKADSSDLPMLMHLHGGGFVRGFIEQDDDRCSRLAEEANCIIVSVEYRLAPEHPFPAALEDAFDVWKWMTSSSRFGGDPKRCAVSGSSAGGHMAIGLALLARQNGAEMPLLQLLTYPVIDPTLTSKSYSAFAEGLPLTKVQMAWFWKQFRGESEPNDVYWAPLEADLTGLPPALIITAEYDVLRDEAEAYAALLRAEGVTADVERYEQMIHGFITIMPEHHASRAALRSSAIALRNAFAQANA